MIKKYKKITRVLNDGTENEIVKEKWKNISEKEKKSIEEKAEI